MNPQTKLVIAALKEMGAYDIIIENDTLKYRHGCNRENTPWFPSTGNKFSQHAELIHLNEIPQTPDDLIDFIEELGLMMESFGL